MEWQIRQWSDFSYRSSLIWVYAVCPGISVRKLRIITVLLFFTHYFSILTVFFFMEMKNLQWIREFMRCLICLWSDSQILEKMQFSQTQVNLNDSEKKIFNKPFNSCYFLEVIISCVLIVCNVAIQIFSVFHFHSFQNSFVCFIK